jgi:glycosyltransferase involved in cell wall biosynthesis
VCLAYLEHYGANAQAVVQRRGFRRILSEGSSDRLFRLIAAPGKDFRRALLSFFAREALRFDARLPGRGRAYLNVGHTGLQERAFLDWTRSADVRSIYMIHDLIPITHPEFCREGEAARHTERVRNMVVSATGIIGNSNDTLDALRAFAHREGLPLPTLLASPLGTDLPQGGSSLPTVVDPPFFLTLGTIEGRKNHLLLLQIWSRLVAARGANTPRLIIVGQRGWQSEEAIKLLDCDEALRGVVDEVGRCSDLQLQAYFRGARALLFPSFAEGYGLPLVEALASGTPVIASDITVFHEIGKGVPDYLHPSDGIGWQTAILAYSEEHSPARIAQLKRMETYKFPTWEDHFAKVDSLMA